MVRTADRPCRRSYRSIAVIMLLLPLIQGWSRNGEIGTNVILLPGDMSKARKGLSIKQSWWCLS